MVIVQFSHLLMMVQHDKKTDTGKLNFGQYHCIIANREVIVTLENQDTVALKILAMDEILKSNDQNIPSSIVFHL